MNLTERRQRYQDIEEYRKRPLVVYATSTRLNVQANMAGDAVREFVDQIELVPADTKAIDVLIHSTGGDPLAAWKLMSLLRERFQKVSVLVPFMAFSAATLFALGADEIVMHPHASLGPIDPQILVKQADGNTKQFAYEDVAAFLRFMATEAKITEQAYLSTVIDKLFSVVDPVVVGAAKRASELSSSIGERLLLTHMTGEDKGNARTIAEHLNKTFFAHGDAVSRRRAKEMHLRIAKEDTALEGLMWRAYLGLESYMQLREPFIALQHYLSNPAAAGALQPVSPLALPPNTPDQFAQNVWNMVLNQAIQRAAAPAVEVPYSVVNALIESTRVASEYRTVGSLSATRLPNGEIRISGVDAESRWKAVSEEPQAPELAPQPSVDAEQPPQAAAAASASEADV